MTRQDEHWSKAAAVYEKEFVDPWQPDVRNNPLKRVVRRLAGERQGVAADLGCGIGPLLPFLTRYFRKVYAVDFAEGMLQRARTKVRGKKVEFVQADLTALPAFGEPWDVALAVNSLVMPSVAAIDASLLAIRQRLRPGGHFLGIVPAMDAVHYHNMLLLERALAAGMPVDAARKNTAHNGDHASYDFAFGQFAFDGLEQHFWQPFEVRHRFARAGFELRRLQKVYLSWRQFACGAELQAQTPPWDWFFLARRA